MKCHAERVIGETVIELFSQSQQNIKCNGVRKPRTEADQQLGWKQQCLRWLPRTMQRNGTAQLPTAHATLRQMIKTEGVAIL